MRGWFFGAAAAAVCASSAQAEQVVLEPSSSWVLDYAENKCRLVRTYGEGEERNVLFLSQHAPSDQFTWTVAGPVVEQMSRARQVNAQFAPGFQTLQISQEDGLTLDGFGQAISGRTYRPLPEYSEALRTALDDDNKEEAERLAALEGVELPKSFKSTGVVHLDTADGARISELALWQGKGPRTVLKLGSLNPAFDAMNACMENLLIHWGVDPKVEATVVERPRWTNKKRVVRSILDRYPRPALDRGEQADFQLRVMVDATGGISGCDLTELTSAKNFSDEVCPLVRSRAEFAPARTADGGAVPSYYISRVLYRIR